MFKIMLALEYQINLKYWLGSFTLIFLVYMIVLDLEASPSTCSFAATFATLSEDVILLLQ